MHAAAKGSISIQSLDARRDRFMRVAWGLRSLLLFDIWALRPFVALEFRRLEPWKIALLSIGDCTCLLWFFWYFIQHFVLGVPLTDKPAAQVNHPSPKWFYTSLALGLSFDFAATLYFGFQDARNTDDAARQTAIVTSMHTAHAVKGLNWHMLSQFRAEDSRTYETIIRLHLTPGDPFPDTLSPATVTALQQDRTGVSLPIRYHAAWPARAWLDGVPDDDNGLMWFSIAVVLLQGACTLLVCLMSWQSLKISRGSGTSPWWLGLHRAIPAAIQILVMAFLGAVLRAFA